MTRALASVALALVALGGCTKARTETVVVVTTEGVRVPDDLDAITLKVADTVDPTNPVFEKSFRICGGDIVDNCLPLPLDFTLIPGGHIDHSSRVQLTATRKTVPVIDNAAIFTFAEGQSLRLDFVLYANCLGVTDCAVRDQACGPDAMCHPVPATPIGGDPDLGAGAPADLAGADLSRSPDFALAVDLAAPNEMSMPLDLAGPVDLASCVPTCAPNFCGLSTCGTPCTCSGLTVCQVNSCNPCGGVNQPCCGAPNPPCQGALQCMAGAPGMCVAIDMAGLGGTQLLTWTTETLSPPANISLHGVWGVSGMIFAVGDGGNIYRHSGITGETFVADNSTTGNTLYRVWGAPPNVYAVGAFNTVLQGMFGSTMWSAAPRPPPDGGPDSYDRSGVFARTIGAGMAEAWVTGGSFAGGPGAQPYVLDHLNGGWGELQRGNAYFYGGIWGDGGSGLFIVGTDSNSFVSMNGGVSFSNVSAPGGGSSIGLHKAWGTSLGNVYAVGDNQKIYHYSSGASFDAQLHSATGSLWGVSGTTSTDIWAVGDNGVVLHSGDAGVTWVQQGNLPGGASACQAQDVIAIASNNVYVVGNCAAQAFIWHGQ